MQSRVLPYDELTPLEQCIADFAARGQTQESKKESKRKRPKLSRETETHYHA